jgi:hypothetical protein
MEENNLENIEIDLSKSVKLLNKALLIENNPAVDEILEKLEKNYNAETIEIVCKLIVENKISNKENAFNFLKNYKQESSIDTILKSVELSNNDYLKQQFVAVLWEANYDCTNHITKVVQYACNGNLLIAIECMSILENSYPITDDYAVSQSIMLLNQSIDKGVAHKDILQEMKKQLLEE